MVNISELVNLNSELVKLYDQGVLDVCSCGEPRIHLNASVFYNLMNGMEVESVKHDKVYERLFVNINGVEFFCLEKAQSDDVV